MSRSPIDAPPDEEMLAGGDGALRGELDRMVAAGKVEAMGPLTVEKWKERERQKETQILAPGRAEGLEFHRRLLGSQAARRFGADADERLSARRIEPCTSQISYNRTTNIVAVQGRRPFGRWFDRLDARRLWRDYRRRRQQE